ncbi:hypothetical protein JET18_00880 [Chryseobacterium sp. L7]|uniref:Uncharacterized protein n=1 Tax=Chryseobacterium endalhagicum TaxID=2797638 RepID=A0ABS1Q9Z7_9FLAO|nr:hypothetical protein [Chryseobacterium endalhagicum]MBL1219376.1 hypothetical protein [Chryseobacterium endalhagicum]
MDQKLLNFNKNLECPNCKFRFNDNNLSKFSCGNCREQIFIRKINNKNYYITKIQNEEIGNIKKSYAIINKYYNSLIIYGYEQVQLENELGKLNWQDTQTIKEFIWSALNNLTLIKTEDIFTRSNLFFTMARYSIDEMDGKGVYEYQKKGFDLRLKDYAKTSSSLVNDLVIIIANQDNPICRIDNNKKFPLQEMIKNPLLPHINTGDKYGCKCMYGRTVERDKKGRIIFNDEEEIQRAIDNMKNKNK